MNERLRIDDPDGCTLENKLLSGNLDMIVSFDISEAIGLVDGGYRRNFKFSAFCIDRKYYSNGHPLSP